MADGAISWEYREYCSQRPAVSKVDSQQYDNTEPDQRVLSLLGT